MAPRGPSQSAESTLRESGPPPKNKDEPDAGRQGSLSSSSSSFSSSQFSLSSTGKRDGGGGETTDATRLSSGDSINGDSEGGKGNGKGAEDDDEEIEGLRSRAKRELKSLRCLVIAVMAAVGAAVSAGTYVFLSATEREKSDSFVRDISLLLLCCVFAFCFAILTYPAFALEIQHHHQQQLRLNSTLSSRIIWRRKRLATSTTSMRGWGS